MCKFYMQICLHVMSIRLAVSCYVYNITLLMPYNIYLQSNSSMYMYHYLCRPCGVHDQGYISLCVSLSHRPLPLYWRGWRPISQYHCSCHLKAALPLIKRLATDSDRTVPISQCQCRFLLEAALQSVERLAATADFSSGTGPCDRRRFMT